MLLVSKWQRWLNSGLSTGNSSVFTECVDSSGELFERALGLLWADRVNPIMRSSESRWLKLSQ